MRRRTNGSHHQGTILTGLERKDHRGTEFGKTEMELKVYSSNNSICKIYLTQPLAIDVMCTVHTHSYKRLMSDGAHQTSHFLIYYITLPDCVES